MDSDLYTKALHSMGGDRDVPPPTTLAPVWPLARELYLRDDNLLEESGHVTA